jgi:hypothetical protein
MGFRYVIQAILMPTPIYADVVDICQWKDDIHQIEQSLHCISRTTRGIAHVMTGRRGRALRVCGHTRQLRLARVHRVYKG